MFSSNTSQVSSGGYEIQRSLRFNAADTTYLNRTPASASNRKTWTWSAWIKRNALAANQYVFNASPDSFVNTFSIVSFGAGASEDKFRFIEFQGGSQVCNLRTTQVFRDSSAWYHFVVAVDTTQATDTNRVKMYVNGAQITSFDVTAYPAQNTDLTMNNNVLTTLGYITTTNNFSGYMTEVNFIDGQALTPSSFGAFDAQTGVWGPTPYGGSYGTNGFYLNFSDNSNTTAATLGKDYSGNGNNWTPNNFSVSAGAGNDSLVDVPTNWGTDTGVGGSVRGNYCTLNPLSTTSGTYTQGNLQYVGPNTGSYVRSNGTLALTTGKWYWEVTLANAPYSPRDGVSAYNAFGFGVSTTFNSTTSLNSVTDAVILEDSGFYKNFSGSVTNGGTAFSSGDVLAVAVDLDANTFTFYRNNTQIATGTIGGTAGRELVPIIISYSNAYGVMDCNFGQRPFAYTAPSGFKALNTQNLPTPTIGATTATQAGKFFNPVLYTGDSAFSRSITGVGFQPDFTWIKSRTGGTYYHILTDVVRGVNSQLFSNDTLAQEARTDRLTAFNSDGFSIGNYPDVNLSPGTYVAWNWKANGAGVSNTAGSITSTVSANTTSGFSVVTFTASANSGTIGHGLGVAPKFIILKSRNNTSNWVCYHASLGADKYINLDGTAGSVTNTATWQNTTPTSTVFSSNGPFLTGWTEVAYCFAEVPGFSKFGSYTGNGSTDGPFVFCGFRPAYLLLKRTDSTNSWIVYDTTRDTINVAGKELLPNSSAAEATYPILDFLSNGFKLRNNAVSVNASGGTYIFAAFASAPQKFALAR